MTEYIDKEQFREALIDYTQKFNDKYKIQEPSKLFDYLCGLGKLLNKYPTANVREYAKGMWIEEEAGYIADSKYTAYCPICRRYVNWFENRYGQADIMILPNYCSYCGADMKTCENE